MSTHTPEQIEAAVDWWAERLVSCRHSGLSDAERRDPGNSGYQLAEMLMTIQRPRVTDEQIAKFKAALMQRLGADTYEARYGVLDVDYGPCPMLADALEAAGIPNRSTLPIKTIMFMRDGRVFVRYGYGAEEQQIYPQVEASGDPSPERVREMDKPAELTDAPRREQQIREQAERSPDAAPGSPTREK